MDAPLALFLMRGLMAYRASMVKKALLLLGATMWVYHTSPPAAPTTAPKPLQKPKTACVYRLHGVRKYTRKPTVVLQSHM